MSHNIRVLLGSIMVTLLLLVLTGCNPQARGFALPPGDAEVGKVTFVELGCNSCHSIKGQIERLTEAGSEDIHVMLGGDVSRVKTYGDLVTSIINPSHRLARGKDVRTLTADGDTLMPTYNGVMTVQQMLDLTTMLQDSYTVWVPQYGPYYFP